MGEDRLAQMLAERIEEDRHLLLDASRLLVHQIVVVTETRKHQRKAASAPVRAARRVADQAEAKAIAAKARQTILLDLTMPNGVAMRFCSGTQMAGFGTAYEKIAERAGTAMVGEVMVEAEVNALLCATPA